MTQPASHGYPDWNRSQAQADVLFVRVDNVTVNNDTTHGRFFIGNQKALGLYFTAAANACQVMVRWFDSNTASTDFMNETYEFPAGTFGTWTVPAVGPFVEVLLILQAANLTYDMRLWAAPERRNFASGGLGVTLISVINTAIGIGVTATNNSNEIYTGPAYWSGWQGVANFVAFLEVVDAAGVVYTLDRWQSAGLDFWRPVYLPPARARIRHVNQSGANTVYNSVLLKAPLLAKA